MAQDAGNLIWIDLEMTGLDTNKDAIIEIATIVTDSQLNILAEGPVLAIHQTDAVLNAPPTPTVTSWATFGPIPPATASASIDPTRTGIGSLKLSGAGGFGVPGAVQTFPASPGQVWDLQGYTLTPTALPGNDTFGLLKIVYRDGSGQDLPMEPSDVLIGQAAAPDFPGGESLPFVDGATPADTWTFTQTRAVAPAGTVEVLFFALFVDHT